MIPSNGSRRCVRYRRFTLVDRLVGQYLGDQCAAVRAEQIEAGPQRGPASTRATRAPRVVIDQDRVLEAATLEISSIPIRISRPTGSPSASTSAPTRVMIDPTARRAIRISWLTALFERCMTSQATVSSKPSVCPAPVPHPRHGCDNNTVPAAGHPRRIALKERPDRARIQRPPPTPTLARVVALSAAQTNPPPRSRASREHHDHRQGGQRSR